MKHDINACKLIPYNVDFKWKILCRSLLNPRKQPKKHMNYCPNVSQFEGDMPESGEEVQEMQNPMAASSRKRQKSTMDKYFALRTT